jgi:type II secretory ATPase GspE/PulE/Tfp pilus assembly ATPase PilB-like protein
MTAMANNEKQYLEDKIRRKLLELRVKSEEDKAQASATKYDIPYANLFFTPVDPEALKTVEESKAREGQLAVIYRQEKTMRMALQNPDNETSKQIIRELTEQGNVITFIMVSGRSLEKAYSFYAKGASTTGVSGATSVNTEKFKEYQEKIKKLGDIPPYLKKISAGSTADVLEFILAAALALDVSDIHFETEELNGKVRYRLDGMLYDAGVVDKRISKSIMLRLKLISGLKINVTEEPQDGRFSIKLGDLTIEIRTSILPGPNGENVVMRILHPKAISVTLQQLGFMEWDYTIISAEIEKPNGLIMVTGPTGSGKTTTLYAIMKKLNTSDMKIITLEDPVEYHVQGLEQIQIDTERGLSFAAGLRSILRQDPDIILVGELRDHETTETAIHAALTGHLVLTTMHTNDAIATIPRLIDVGAKSAIISPAVNLAVGQRLLRKVCVQCKNTSKALPEELELLKLELKNCPARIDFTKLPKIDENLELARPVGCPACNNTGYKGRIGVYELLVIDAEFKEFILTDPSYAALKQKANQKGFASMRQDAFIKIISGITDVAEVQRILGKEAD